MRKSIFISIICCLVFSKGSGQKKYNEVTLPELMTKLRRHDSNMVIVDVRTPGEFQDTASRYQQSNIGRIKGAINIPLQDFRKDPATIHLLDAYRDKDIYVICSHGFRS